MASPFYKIKLDNCWYVQIIIFRNPINSASEAIHVRDPTLLTGQTLVPALMASGFGRILDMGRFKVTLLPCPLGTFSNSSTKGADGCTECPPGLL